MSAPAAARQPEDGSILAFVRLKCFSVARTTKFYTSCLGFDLKRKSELEDGALTLIVLTPKTDESTPLNLRFECERYKQLKFSKAAKVPICTTSRVKLIFYVRDLRSVILSVERSSTGAWVFCPPQRHSTVLIAIIVDPNGILVELVEMPNALQKVPAHLLNPGDARLPNATQVPIRFGHALLRSPSALEQAQYFEALFRPRTDTHVARKSRLSTIGPQTRGISIVDKEDFPELLATYVWIGAGPRSHHSTLCFMHRVERRSIEVPRTRFAGNARAGASIASSFKSKAASDPESEDSSFTARKDAAKSAFQFLMETKSAEEIDPFLGLGIMVSDLDETRARLQRHTRYPVKFYDEPHEDEAVGRLCSFADEHGVLVHLIDSQSAFLIDNPKDQPFAGRRPRGIRVVRARGLSQTLPGAALAPSRRPAALVAHPLVLAQPRLQARQELALAMDIRSFFGTKSSAARGGAGAGGGARGANTAAKSDKKKAAAEAAEEGAQVGEQLDVGAAAAATTKKTTKKKKLVRKKRSNSSASESSASSASSADVPSSPKGKGAKEKKRKRIVSDAESDTEVKPTKVLVTEDSKAGNGKRVQKSSSIQPGPSVAAVNGEVPYQWVSEAFDKIEATTKRLEIQRILCDLFVKVLDTSQAALLPCVYICSGQVAPAFHGIEIGVGDALLMKAIANSTGRTKASISNKYEELGDLGTVAMVCKKSQNTLFGSKPKSLAIDHVLTQMRKVADIGAQDAKEKIILKMLSSAKGTEAKYLVRFLQGKLRIGLAEQTVVISLAHALCEFHYKQQLAALGNPSGSRDEERDEDEEMDEDEDDKQTKRIKWNPTDAKVREDAVATLKQVQCELPIYDEILEVCLKPTKPNEMWYKILRNECHIRAGVPLKPMLAKPTNGVSVVLDRFSDRAFSCEYKYDGERAQIHMVTKDDRKTPEVKVYSRNSEDNTAKYPDIVQDILAAFKTEGDDAVSSFIMDAEAVAYDVNQATLLPFQILSTRARKDVNIEDVKVKVIVCAFDLLFLNGESLLERPLEERRALLRKHFQPVEHKFRFAVSMDGNDTEEIEAFLNKAVEDKCEGLMVKALQGPESFYQPARRSLNWLKLKKDYLNNLADSLDLVPIGAFHGRGKRTGVFGAYVLACYDPDLECFQSITKIGTGFSDEALKEFTELLKKSVIDDMPSSYDCDLAPDVWFSPSHVWEVRAADLSISPLHRAAVGKVDASKGIALRFPRFLRIREDKTAEDATSAAQVADMYQSQSLASGSKVNAEEDM
ncbi:DNA ligase 1 [Hondaea fermentalgiana]|uniref:DNA ligase n=1 Tax=Hondaea fermentalgiana TaxID=2315210 RepID=A0A2R5G8P8_9STRA|nr:DNA ligase 1 [Hondaea fermentalgiana]|eukprot:GBG26158.1 DNA ligase 1 [Hondaea fermentalgiana]